MNGDEPARFNAMADRLECAIRSRDELVQAVSHELGSPLSRLRFHLALLGGADGSARADRLDAMARELGALDALVEELFGYVQADEVELNLRSFDPNRGLADLAELPTLDAPDQRASDVKLVRCEEVRLVADERPFMRAVENILRKAVRHARTRVHVELPACDGAPPRSGRRCRPDHRAVALRCGPSPR